MIKWQKKFIEREENFFCDFHIHSNYSFDSITPIKKIITISKKKKIDCIAITDHNSIQGAIEAKKKTDKTLMIITGSEIRTEYGDIIGLFLNEEIHSRIFFEVVDEIKTQGGLIIAPHPFKSKIKDYLSYVHIIEVVNARISDNQNDQAFEYAAQNNIPGIGSSDAHLGYEIGRIQTVFSHPVNDEDDLRQAIIRNDCEIHGYPSPKWVHYFSASIGAVKTKNFRKLLHSVVKKISE